MRLKKLPRQQVAALEQAFHTARNPTEKLRYQAILLAVKGFTRSEICQIVEKSPRSIGGWVWRYNKKGLAGLRTKPYQGNHRLLTNTQKATIKQLITHKTPEELSLSGRLWTIPLVEQLVWQQFHLRYKDQDSYRRLFHWCGFTFHKPNKVNKKQSTHLKKRFEETLKKDSGSTRTKIAWYW
jgi:transposase